MRFLIHASVALALTLSGLIALNLNLITVEALVIIAAITIFIGSLSISCGQIFSPSFMFSFPWVCLLLCSILDVSRYSRPISPESQELIITTTVLGCLAGSIFFRSLPPAQELSLDVSFPKHKNWEALYGLFVLAFSTLNITYSGYIPLISALSSGVSGYLEFGIPSLLGLFYAIINSASLVFFIKYKKQKSFTTGLCIALAFVVQFLFYSRQNVIFLLIELYILNCFISGFPNIIRVMCAATLFLILFAYAGELRSGDIRELIDLNNNYKDMPTAMIWLYGYSYFNVLNLDNVVTSVRPKFDGSSVQQLLPSILRPNKSDSDSGLLELSNFNVSSYLSGIYEDVGFLGCCLFIVFIASAISYFYYVRRVRLKILDASAACISSVLLVASAFSFFHNFFFFPPVIFQVVFAPLLISLFADRRYATHSYET